MKKKIPPLLLGAFALAVVSCSGESDLSGASVVFYNFSSLTITELTVYRPETLNAVHTYTGGIAPDRYHIFELPGGNYIFKAKTEDGALYGSEKIFHTAVLYTDVILSVDYEILEYD
jgi:hypothetical protein